MFVGAGGSRIVDTCETYEDALVSISKQLAGRYEIAKTYVVK